MKGTMLYTYTAKIVLHYVEINFDSILGGNYKVWPSLLFVTPRSFIFKHKHPSPHSALKSVPYTFPPIYSYLVTKYLVIFPKSETNLINYNTLLCVFFKCKWHYLCFKILSTVTGKYAIYLERNSQNDI